MARNHRSRSCGTIGHVVPELTVTIGRNTQLVVELAEFDKKLRLMVMYAIESIEIAVRVAIGHRLGRFDIEAHLNPALLDGRFTRHIKNGSSHQDWLARFHKACESSKEDFIEHHRTQYGGRLPVWVAIEVWDFGLLSRFFAGMQHRDQNAIAASFGVFDGDAMRTWLRTFNFARNVSAHHGRLWNRTNTEIPVLPPLERCRVLGVLHRNIASRAKLFGALTCMKVLMRAINDGSAWQDQVKAHVLTFPKSDLVSLSMAGFPDGWQDDAAWA